MAPPSTSSLCPLCGHPNGCRVSADTDAGTACWCLEVRIAPEVLARVPAEALGKRCICRRCAGEGTGAAGAAPERREPAP